LSPSIRSDLLWNAESGHPAADQCLGAARRQSGPKRNGLSPAGGPVHDSEEVCETLPRNREGSYQVDVNVAEPLDGVGDEARRRDRLRGDLGPLALLTVLHQAAT
jgi:hypothetical protein